MHSLKKKLRGTKGSLASLAKRRRQLLSKTIRRQDSGTPPPELQPIVDPKLNFATPSTLFESLIAPLSVASFFEDYWEQKPLVVKSAVTPSRASDLFSFDDLRRWVWRTKGLSFGRHVNVCRYVDGKRESLNEDHVGRGGGGKLTSEKLERLWREKRATFQVHQPQHSKDILWRILGHLESYFGCLVGSNIYMTPAGSQGLAPHYDDVEVFIIQLEGSKRWRLYANAQSLPQDYSRDFSQEEIGEPTHDIVLETGDLMYFPRGTIHQAYTAPDGSHSTHITISTYQHNAWGDLLRVMVQDGLRQAMDKEVAFRRGIPCNLLGLPGGFHLKVGGATDEMGGASDKVVDLSTVRAHAVELIGKLTDFLQERASVQTYSMDFIASRLPPYGYSKESTLQGPMPSLKNTVVLCWPDHTYLLEGCDEEDQRWTFVYHSLNNLRDTHMMTSAHGQECKPSGVKFPIHFGVALKELFSSPGRCIQASKLAASNDEDRQCILTTLWAEGLIRVAL